MPDQVLELAEAPRYRIVTQSNYQQIDRVGPLIEGSWSRHDDELGREARGQFLIDTGAFGAMIDEEIAELLQLNPQGSREIHGIHGYGRLQQFLGRVSLPVLDQNGNPATFTTVIECVAVPSLTAKNRAHGVEVVGILGRLFLRRARLVVDALTGRVELLIHDPGGANNG